MEILFLFIFLFAVLSDITFLIKFRQDRERRKAVWRQLAATHHLNFVLDDSFFGNGAYVNGIYRNHPLVLRTIPLKWRRDHSATRIEAFAHSRQANRQPGQDQAHPTLPLQEVINRFTSLADIYGIKAEPNGYPIYCELPDIVETIQLLEHLFDLLTDLAEAYTVATVQGGEAIPALQPALENKASRQTVLQLVEEIASDTYKRLAHHAHRLLCPRCLTRFSSHTLHLPWYKDLIYYGCRMCSQSREFYEGSVVAILDNQTTDTPVQQNDTLALRVPSGITLPLLVNASYPVGGVRVNWSTHQKLFDFDTVEIIQATDEEAERFAVQVGNDTDETRKARYQEMQCAINPNCQLSENTLRILRRTFGQVVSGEENKLKDKLNEDEKLSEQKSS